MVVVDARCPDAPAGGQTAPDQAAHELAAGRGHQALLQGQAYTHLPSQDGNRSLHRRMAPFLPH